MNNTAKKAAELLSQFRLHAPEITLPEITAFIEGKSKTREGKTLMQCFEPNASIMDRVKGAYIFENYLSKSIPTYPDKLVKYVGDNGKISVQAMQTSTDFPLWTTSGNEVVMNLQNVDVGWMQAYRQLRIDEGQKFAEFGEGNHELTFYDMEEGEEYRSNNLSATKYTLKVGKRGAAYDITDEVMLFNNFVANLDLSASLMNAYAVKMQSIHYGEIVDAATTNISNLVSYQSGANTLEKDINTINKSLDYIYNAMLNKIQNAANAPILMYVSGNDSFRSRMKTALGTIAPNLQTSVTISNRPITMIPTSNLKTGAGVAVSATRVLFLLPGRLIVKATKRELQMERYRDPTKDVNKTKANFYCGAGVADTTQTVFADFA